MLKDFGNCLCIDDRLKMFKKTSSGSVNNQFVEAERLTDSKMNMKAQESDPDGFKILVLLHQLLLQLHDFGHGLVLHVLQLLRHLQRQQARRNRVTG